jgi:7-cyano-7-deazaguanine synthase
MINLDINIDKSLVVLSGGQDSTTVLYYAKKQHKEVEVITFFYNQRHKKEIVRATRIANFANVPINIVNAEFINKLSISALTRDIPISQEKGELPNTFVDGRNLFFLSMAAVTAKQKGINVIYTGVSQSDYSGYPDCRRGFIDSLERTLCLGMDYNFSIVTPLMNLSKKQEVGMAVSLGPECMKAIGMSWTCYEGGEKPCGECPACVLRQKGFEAAGVKDPALIEY